MLDDQGETAGARGLCEEAIAGYTESVGSAHESTLKAKMNLAILLANEGEMARARELLEEVVAGYTESLGSAHESTLFAKANLAVLLDMLQ